MIKKQQVLDKGFSVLDSNDLSQQEQDSKIEQLKKLVPGLVNSDNQVNIEALQDFIDISRTTSNNRGYELTFAGKGLARSQADIPTTQELKVEAMQSKNFDKTRNVVIRGDNLEVLKILKQNYFEKLKMIYIDPPYNTGNDDFIYNNDFKQNEEELIASFSLEEATIDFLHNVYGTRSHSGWLAFMYPRLRLARDLLREDGVIFISIDDNEVANLRIMCDEIFGEENFVATIHVEMSATQGMKVKAAKAGNIVKNAEYCLVYSKNGKQDIGYKTLLNPEKYDNHYSLYLEKLDGQIYKERFLKDKIKEQKHIINELILLNLIKNENSSIDIARCYKFSPLLKQFIHSISHNIVRTHDSVEPSQKLKDKAQIGFVYEYSTQERNYLIAKSKTNGGFYQRIRLSEKLEKADDFFSTFGPTNIRGDWWEGFYLDMGNISKEGSIKYENGKKPVRLIRQLIEFSTTFNDLILDFFAGSGTTGDAVMQLNAEDGGNRKFILVQWDERIKEKTDAYQFCQEHKFEPVISSITIERLNRAGEKIKKELSEKNLFKTKKSAIDIGYKVFSLVDKPKIIESKREGSLFKVANERQSTSNTLINMLCATCKPLDTPIEVIEEDKLYQADNEIYVLGEVLGEKLEEYKNLKINIDGWSDISLENWLNLDIIDKENITVIY